MAGNLPPGVTRLRIVIEEPSIYRAEVTFRGLDTVFGYGTTMQGAETDALTARIPLPANPRLARIKSCERTQDRVPYRPTGWE